MARSHWNGSRSAWSGDGIGHRPKVLATGIPQCRVMHADNPVTVSPFRGIALKRVALLLSAVLVTGCSLPLRMVPDNPIPISNSFQPPLDGVVAGLVIGAAAWYVLDPKAPNWEVKTLRLDTERVEIRLRKKRFSTGGDGEAQWLFQQHAREIADRNGAGGFQILSYTEEIDSETTFARRLTRGVVRLLPPA